MENRKPDTKLVNGIVVPTSFPTENVIEAMDYKPRDDDVFIVTYPKSGTTWMQCIIHMIRTKCTGDMKAIRRDTPMIEVIGTSTLEEFERPLMMKCHFPYSHYPWNDQAKYLFICRNPFDVCTSFFYHTIGLPEYKWEHGTFDEFFELFMNGEHDYGSYFIHLRDWYAMRDRENVLFLTYEQMKSDIHNVLGIVGQFLGGKIQENLEIEGMLQKVVEMSSFGNMKKNHISRPGVKSNFIRKGIIGDYLNHFSAEQVERLSNKFREFFEETEVMNLWAGYGITF